MKPSTKWKFAIGTTSRVPNSKEGLHYFIADFDEIDFWNNLDWYGSMEMQICHNLIFQKTFNGWHLYSDRTMPFKELVKLLKKVHADPAWIRIGVKRGYFFLADKMEVNFSWPVEHMVLTHGKKKA